MKASVRLEGTEEMARNLKTVETRVLTRGLKASLMEAAELIRADAERRAPVRSGRLARHMLAEWDGRRRRARIGPHKESYYGEFQEKGTSRHRAQPFLRPALDANQARAFEIIAKGLGRSLG